MVRISDLGAARTNAMIRNEHATQGRNHSLAQMQCALVVRGRELPFTLNMNRLPMPKPISLADRHYMMKIDEFAVDEYPD